MHPGIQVEERGFAIASGVVPLSTIENVLELDAIGCVETGRSVSNADVVVVGLQYEVPSQIPTVVPDP